MTLEKAEKIVVPRLEFEQARLSEALDFVRAKARELDPDKQGLNIVCKPKAGAAEPALTLSLTNIPLSELLKYIANLADLELTFGNDGILLGPRASDR